VRKQAAAGQADAGAKSSGAKALLVVAALTTLTACARTPPPAQMAPDAARADAGTLHRISMAPEQGAICIAGNAETVREGAVAHVQPLYGTQRVAVVVRTRPGGGDALAVAYVDQNSAGSQVRLTTTNQFTGDRDELAQRLLTGC
jgi:hypothetical protein